MEPQEFFWMGPKGCFGVQVGGVGDSFGMYFASCRTQVGVLEAKRPQGIGLEGLGLAQGLLGTRIWVQHEPNLNQAGVNVQSIRNAFWSQLESKLPR